MKAEQKSLLDGLDPEITAPLISRRDAIRRGASMSSLVAAGLATGSVPVALAVLSKDVYGQTLPNILDALQFAYILENLENEFYKAVLGTSAVGAQNAAFAPVRALIPAPAQQAFQQIQKHEAAHVTFIRTAIQGVGGAVPDITANDFDFTGGNGSGTGPFARATTELDFLLLAAQAFEDTGVRAYKGQAGRLLINGDATADIALEAALRIHSVEARHAAKLRRIRRQRNPSDTSLRYSGYVQGSALAAAGAGNITNPPAAVVEALNLIYGGGAAGGVSAAEGNTSHVVFNGTAAVTINAATLPNTDVIGNAGQKVNAAQMAFDEALTKEEVVAIVRGFIKDAPTRGLP